MNHNVSTLSGPELRLALAHSLRLNYKVLIEPAYGVGARISIKDSFEFFRPDVNWKQAGPLVETYWVAITKWLQKHFGHTWVGYVDRSEDPVLVWFMRAIVGYLNPDLCGIPFDDLAPKEDSGNQDQTQNQQPRHKESPILKYNRPHYLGGLSNKE